MENGDQPDRSGGSPFLIAFHGTEPPAMEVQPAPRFRSWMEGTGAKRCLPLLIANQAGWFLLNPHGFTATWRGGEERANLEVEYDDPLPLEQRALSHFGHGILSWTMPYLFRTPPDYALLARGPSNWPKDGACALEGLVETDWAAATFTMNWKLTRPDLPVRWEAGEPFCMIVPQRRGELEAFRPQMRDASTDPETRRANQQWAEQRHRTQVQKFLSEYAPSMEAERKGWEKDYFKGTTPDGTSAPNHLKTLKLARFEPAEQPEQTH